MQSLDSLGEKILELLSRSPAIGNTPRQLSLALNADEPLIVQELTHLEKFGKAFRFGRGLWSLSIFEKVDALNELVSSEDYLDNFRAQYPHITLLHFRGSVTFSSNLNRPVHRWSSYVQGFSGDFVDQTIERYGLNKGDAVIDCFCGSGTTPLCAKLKGINAVGVDLSPLMAFASSVKTSPETYRVDPREIEIALSKIKTSATRIDSGAELPFLKGTRGHFSPAVLQGLADLKCAILQSVQDRCIQDILLLAFTSVLIECSRLIRAPCLGYAAKPEIVDRAAPLTFFERKVLWMVQDLRDVQRDENRLGTVHIVNEDASLHKYEERSAELAITSPPYANGLDYVTNYKIEMAWLGLAKSYRDLRDLRDRMVSSDNVSRGSLERYFESHTAMVHDTWLDEILAKVRRNVALKKTFRRRDMDLVLKKYFEDMHDAFQNVHGALKVGGRFVIVVGDSLTAGAYLPTDLILARIGRSIGFEVEDIEVARTRRSGQRRDFKLRESIVTLAKT